jgi:hypothetical protein
VNFNRDSRVPVDVHLTERRYRDWSDGCSKTGRSNHSAGIARRRRGLRPDLLRGFSRYQRGARIPAGSAGPRSWHWHPDLANFPSPPFLRGRRALRT